MFDSAGNQIWYTDGGREVGHVGYPSIFSAFREHTFTTPGIYFIAVGEYYSGGLNASGAGGDAIDNGDIYTLHISINKPPVINTPSPINYIDTANDDTFTAQTGTLTATDPEGQTLIYGITGGAGSGTNITKTGTYGTLTLDSTTGQYTFTPNDSAIEALTSNATENFEVTVSDGIATDSKTLAINLTGVNDKPYFPISLTPDTSISLPGVYFASVAWGDYSGDGKLDLILTGNSSSGRISKLYKNNGSGGLSEDTSLTLPGVQQGSVAWGDYTGDGKLDLILTGLNSSSTLTSKLYKNNGSGGLIEDTSLTLSNVYNSSVAWGDYSGDGKLDLILTGYSSSGRISKLYKNNGSGGLTEDTSLTLSGVEQGSVAWGDYTGDGKLDLILTGLNSSNTRISKLYKNNGSGGLTEDTSLTLPNVYRSSVAWGDYTGDGKLDLILTGLDSSNNSISKLYKNNGSGGLTEDTSLTLPGVYYFNSVAWGDYSGDSKLDLILTGYNTSTKTDITKLYKNNGSGGLTEDTSLTLPGVEASSVGWGDYSGDGKRDLILTGFNISGYVANLYKAVAAPITISYTDTAIDDTFTPQNGTLTATDQEGQTLTYGITGGTASSTTITKTGTYGTLTLNSTTGQYTFTPNDSAIEALTSNATENFEVTVSDGTATDSTTLAINLIGANDKPVVTPASFTIQENSANDTAVGTVTGSDAENSTLVNWTITDGNTDVDGDTNLAFVIDSTTGEITVNDSGDLDFETQAQFSLQVTASDGAATSNPAVVTVNLLNVLELTPGNDVGNGTSGNDVMDAQDGDDRVYGYGGNDTILAGIGADIAYGGDGNDFVNGGDGNDRLYGDAGNDTLLGGAGADILYGGAGDDLLNGGLGSDRYYGDAGVDTFVIGSGQGIDSIYGYQIGIDKIQVLGSSIVEQKSGTSVLLTSVTNGVTEILATVYNAAPGQISYIQSEVN